MFDLPLTFQESFSNIYQDSLESLSNSNVNAKEVAIAISLLTALAYAGPYLRDRYSIKANGVEGPVLARFSDFWLGRLSIQGNRSTVMHELHKKYGKSLCLFGHHEF